ncbi:MAG: AMP-binding protein [Bacteroidetes bacterium]|nr:AMP-binding protein [Bacteroidota bacterium]
MKPHTIALFEKTFKTFANSIAFCINEQYISYRELAQHIAGVQLKITKLNPASNKIGILTDNSIETYAAILGVWISGKTFVPMNPDNPVKRNLEILSDAGITVILSRDPIVDEELRRNREIICIDALKSDKEINFNLSNIEETAYILFTSGSTGKPKGVQISWKNLDAFVESYFDIGFQLTHNDRFLQMFDFSFDGSIMSFLPALCTGACSFTISTSELKFMEVIRILEEKEITTALIVPSVLTFLKPYFNEIHLEKFRYCIVGAEASYNATIGLWKDCIPNAEIYNFYGPTESTVFCLFYHFDPSQNKNKSYNGMMCLGRPIKNMEVYICNPENNEFLSANTRGEIVISGRQLTKGYLNNPEKNREAFFSVKNGKSEKRFYKTGDEGLCDEEGDFYYCGRIDNQVQIQGFRVELSEIEYPVREYFKIDALVAIEKKDKNQNSEIYLFVENFKGDTNDIMTHLKKSIPSYMLPSGIINLPKLPLNPNGKIDRKVLSGLLEKQRD